MISFILQFQPQRYFRDKGALGEIIKYLKYIFIPALDFFEVEVLSKLLRFPYLQHLGRYWFSGIDILSHFISFYSAYLYKSSAIKSNCIKIHIPFTFTLEGDRKMSSTELWVLSFKAGKEKGWIPSIYQPLQSKNCVWVDCCGLGWFLVIMLSE